METLRFANLDYVKINEFNLWTLKLIKEHWKEPALTLSTLGKIVSIRHFEILLLFIPGNRIWYFMQIVICMKCQIQFLFEKQKNMNVSTVKLTKSMILYRAYYNMAGSKQTPPPPQPPTLSPHFIWILKNIIKSMTWNTASSSVRFGSESKRHHSAFVLLMSIPCQHST